jgi:hypothetical protein
MNKEAIQDVWKVAPEEASLAQVWFFKEDKPHQRHIKTVFYTRTLPKNQSEADK